MQNKSDPGCLLKKNFSLLSAISIVLFFLLSGCENKSQTVQVNESKVNIQITTDTIRVNNCGNSNAANQTIERRIEISSQGDELFLIQRAVENKYTRPQSNQAITLNIPPNSNMVYHISWTEEVYTGFVIVDETQSPYSVHQPIALQSLEAIDSGCSAAYNPTASSSIPTHTIPEFPWPPPTPSAIADLTLGVRPGDSLSLGNIDSKITFALNKGGYDEFSYFGVPNGFAIVTRIEQINPYGIPEYSNRWVSELSPISLKNFSINKYFEALFSAPRGYYRIFVFIVTPDLVIQSGTPVSQSEAEAWSIEGANKLPSYLKFLSYTSEYQTTAYVYEFVQSGVGSKVNQNIPSIISGKQHLENSGILDLLEKRP